MGQLHQPGLQNNSNKIWSSVNNITLTGYNETTPYKVPCDGYVRVNVWASGSSMIVYTFIRNANGDGIKTSIISSQQISVVSMFVKKGERLLAEATGNSVSAVFYPLVDE